MWMYYNAEAYLPKAIKQARKAAKDGTHVIEKRTPAQDAADDARFAYKAGGGGLRQRPKKTSAV